MDQSVSLAVLLPLIAASLALSVVPLWFAAQVVGAGRTEFSRAALALFLPTAASVLVLFLMGWRGVLLIPLLFLVSFKVLLSTSFLGAFVLALLWLAFNAMLNKFFGALAW